MREMLEHLRKFDGEEQMRQADSSEQDWGQRWLLGRGWNQDYFTDEQRFPTRWDLDKVSTVRPVCVTRACGHCCVVNSRGLEIMGVTGDTPQPEGGCFELDAAGEPNGIFRENAVEYVSSHIPAPSLEQIKEMMRLAIRKLNAYGVTSVQTDDFETLPVPYELVIRAYQELEQEGDLTVRVYEAGAVYVPGNAGEISGIRVEYGRRKPPFPDRSAEDCCRRVSRFQNRISEPALSG